jgi:hypothetical protein
MTPPGVGWVYIPQEAAMRKLIALRAEAIRLRLEERLSLKEIEAKLGVSRGSLSSWLRQFPLTEEERLQKVREKKRGNSWGSKRIRREESKYHRMVAPGPLTSHRRAKIAEAAVLFRLTLQGFTAYASCFDGEKVDWLVIEEATGRVLRVEVRCVHMQKYGYPFIRLRCSDGRGRCRRMRQDEFDILVGYDLYIDTAYVFTAQELENHSACVSACPDAAERWDKLRAS